MLEFDMDLQNAVLTVRPKGSLTADDFQEITTAVDTYLESGRDLTGMVVHAEAFPGWESFGGMARHFRFIRDHHKHIRKVAIVSDSALMTELPAIASHFVRARIMHFPYDDIELAMEWILEDASGESKGD
ncbi:MAG TPA: STAS/SEC14 domain-containing protein [Mariprofundaceae bacterium]|nr:STAS/SEC14 domain-containing protein [Mariprofundaceae bacterium]